MIVDFHTHVWWYPDHLNDEFIADGLAAKRVKMANSPDVFFAGDDLHSFDATPEQHWEAAQAADLTVVLGFTAHHLGIVVPNEIIAEYVASKPGRLIGFASVDPREPGAIEQLTYCRTELGLVGLKLSPVYQHFNPLDPDLRDFFAAAERLGLVTLWHQGTTFSRRAPLRWASPVLLESLALEYPDLKIIIAHLGHPWEDEAIVVARKQPNVWLDVSAIHYRPWRCWNALTAAREYGVVPKLLLGSDFPSATIDQVIVGLRNVNQVVSGTGLPIFPEADVEDIISTNWRRFFMEAAWEVPQS